jgi:SNF2 family DNA or RNA helicase
VAGNWARESERFTPDLTVLMHHGATRAREAAFEKAALAADIVITTYALATRDRTVLAKVPWRRIVLDEAQNVKNPEAKQTKAVRALPSPRKVALTGTPVENHLGELWSIMEILNPSLLGSAASFRERFVIPVERFRDEEAAEQLRRLTRPFILRRLKTDRTIVPDLPEKMEMNELCTLTKEQVTLYQAVVDDMLRRIDEADGHRPQGAGADRHAAPQAGVQPPGPVPGRRLRPARALGEARAGRRNPRRGARLG